jgi:hypothetical protein
MISSSDGRFEEWRQQNASDLKKVVSSRGASSRITPVSGVAAVGRNPIHPPGRRVTDPITPSIYAQNPRPPIQPWINDVDDLSDFYSPQQPMWPQGPDYGNTHPREWDYPIGYNLNYINSRIELLQMLRGMRASWGVLATVISTRQDQLARIPWTIQRKDKPQLKSAAVDEMKKFFHRPDGRLKYSQWMMKFTDDLLVIDQPCLYMFNNRAGKPINAMVMDGATFFPLIDDLGRTPATEFRIDEYGQRHLERQPAYQQIIKGMPFVDLDESELMYIPMRPRSYLPMFGYPGTEQVMIEATEAIRKTIYQSNFWSEGTIPDLVVSVPEQWTPRQIAMFQAYFDAMLSGNLRLKSKVRFLPGGMKPYDIKNSSGESLWSKRDETLIRLICYAYSVSPTPFITQVNRSVAQNAQESAEQEGLYPLMSYWKDNVMDVIIQEKFGYDDVEFLFLPRPERDAEKQAKVLDMYVKRGIFSRNQALEQLGEQPIPGGDAHTIELGNAIVPVEDAANGLALPLGTPGASSNAGTNRGSSASNSSRRAPAEASPQRGTPRPNHEAPAIAKLSGYEVDQAARLADGDPNRHSHARLEAGNYQKGHVNIGGLNISIENSRFSTRGKKNPDGSLRWSAQMAAHYGYVRGTIGADGEQVDVFIGRRPDLLDRVFIIDQMKTKKSGKIKFDEHKVMLGYKSLKKALKDYKKSYGDRVAVGSVTELSFDEFKNWLKNGDLSKPFVNRVSAAMVHGSDAFFID